MSVSSYIYSKRENVAIELGSSLYEDKHMIHKALKELPEGVYMSEMELHFFTGKSVPIFIPYDKDKYWSIFSYKGSIDIQKQRPQYKLVLNIINDFIEDIKGIVGVYR